MESKINNIKSTKKRNRYCIAIVGSHFACGHNTTPFQRLTKLCSTFQSFILCRIFPCPQIARLAKKVKKCPEIGGIYHKMFFPLWVWWSVKRLRKVSLVYTTNYHQAILAGYLLKKSGLIWVVDLWDTPSLGVDLGMQRTTFIRRVRFLYHKLALLLVKRVLPRADLIIVGMHPGVLRHFGVDPCAPNVLPVTNGVDLRKAHPSKCHQPTQTFRIIYVGPVQRSRGIDILLKAAKLLKEARINFHLQLVGEILKEEKAWIQKALVDWELDQVDLLGFLPHSCVLKMIATSDVCVCTLSPRILNYQYAYPIKIFEYMAMGKPVVCTRMKGTERIIKNGETGLLVPPDDPQALAEAILKLYHDPNLRQKLGQNARKAVTEYDWNKINAQIVERIENLLKERIK